MPTTRIAFTFPLLLAMAGCALMGKEERALPADDFLDAEIATIGMDHLSGSPVVLLRELESGRTVPIWIGISEAQAIAHALHNVASPRPMTHDLAVSLMEVAGAAIEELVVHEMRGGIFYGALRLRLPGQDSLVAVDCRPSDGLALAVRTGARIRLAEGLLGEAPPVQFVPPPTVDQVVQILGLTVVTATAALREELGLGDRPGVVVSAVRESALERGFQRGDLIIRVNELVPESPVQFLEEVMRVRPAGRETEVRILRDGEEQQLRLPVTRDPEGGVAI